MSEEEGGQVEVQDENVKDFYMRIVAECVEDMQVEGPSSVAANTETVNSVNDMKADDGKSVSLIRSDVLSKSSNSNILPSEEPCRLQSQSSAHLDHTPVTTDVHTHVDKQHSNAVVHVIELTNSKTVKRGVSPIIETRMCLEEENDSVDRKGERKDLETGKIIKFGDSEQETPNNSKQSDILSNGMNKAVQNSKDGSKSDKSLSMECENLDMESQVSSLKTESNFKGKGHSVSDEKLTFNSVHKNKVLSSSTLIKCELSKICTEESEMAVDLSLKTRRLNAEKSRALEINCMDRFSESGGNNVTHLNKLENSDETDSKISDDLSSHHEKNNSALPQEIKGSFNKVIPLDSNVTKSVQQQSKDSISDGSKKVNSSSDAEIICVNETIKSEPVECSVPKYTFKNILQMPSSHLRDKVASNSKKDSIAVDEAERLKSTKQSVLLKLKTVINSTSERVSDKQTAQPLVSQNYASGKSQAEVDSSKSVQTKESPNSRKRIQSDCNISTSKRVKLEPDVNRPEESPEVSLEADVILSEKSAKNTESGDHTAHKEDKAILLSSEVLQSIIALRVKTAIKNHKQANFDRLNLRTRGMLSASGLWKETVKHLERSVLELSTLSQKLEKQKTQLTSVKENSSATKSQESVEPSGVHSLPVSALPSAPTQTQQGQQQTRQTQVQSVASSNPTQQNTVQAAQSPLSRSHGRAGRPRHSPPISSSFPPIAPRQFNSTPSAKTAANKAQEAPEAAENIINLIDLTDEEDSAKKTDTQTSKPISSQLLSHSVNKILTGGKSSVSAPGNGYIQQSSVPQGSTSNLHSSSSQGKQSLVTAPPLTPVSPVLDVAGSQYQLVTINSSSTPHNGAFLALVPSTSPNTSAVPGQSNMSANVRPTPQTSAQTVTDAATTGSAKSAALSLPPSFRISSKHPAPLPSIMDSGNAPPSAKNRPPKPTLRISRVSQGIVLSWNMPSLVDVEKISSYQLFAYQESDVTTPKSSLWKKVGEVNALPLPMACTLTQFQEGNKYHFAVRAVDQYGRCGLYSDPSSIFLGTDT